MATYTLHYFDGRARAELTRLIFAAAGVEFTDNRIDYFNGWNDEIKARNNFFFTFLLLSSKF